MKYMNASQAARRIGVSDKTIRRWLKEGKISAIRVSSNQLAIPESEVELLRRQRALFSQDEVDTQENITTLASKVAELEQKIFMLEGKAGSVEPVAEINENPSKTNALADNAPSVEKPQKRVYTMLEGIPEDLPDGSMKLIDFIVSLGLPESSFSRWIDKGIRRGEKIEVTTRAKASGVGRQHYLTPDQQKAANRLLRRHGKIKTNDD